MKEQLEKLEQLKQSIASLDKQYREIKGYGETVNATPESPEMQDIMYRLISNVYNYVDNSLGYVYKWIDEHGKNHTPKLPLPTHMQNFIDAVGLSDDVEVKKIEIPSYSYKITASRKNGVKMELDLVKK